MELPKLGELITFESGDAENIVQQTVVFVQQAEVQPHGFGMVNVYGCTMWNGHQSSGQKVFQVMTATLDARRVHRRG